MTDWSRVDALSCHSRAGGTSAERAGRPKAGPACAGMTTSEFEDTLPGLFVLVFVRLIFRRSLARSTPPRQPPREPPGASTRNQSGDREAAGPGAAALAKHVAARGQERDHREPKAGV